MIRWLIFISIVLFVDFYAFQSVKTFTKNKIVAVVYWLLSLTILMNFTYKLVSFDRANGLSPSLMFAFGLLVLSSIPKILALVVLFSEDFFRFFKGVLNYFSTNASPTFFSDRRAFVSKVALGIAAIPFASVLYGMAHGKYNYQVIKHTLFFDDLPKAFDGLKLTQISDIHSDNFDDVSKISHGIDLINE